MGKMDRRGALIRSKLMTIKLLSAFMFGVLMLGSSCNSGEAKTDPSPTAARVSVPPFNSDSAYVYIEKQLSFGYRVPGTEAHRQCGDWLSDKLSSFGFQVKKQSFRARFGGRDDVTSFNIIGQLNPEHPRRILLGAHWDTRDQAEKDNDPNRRNDPIPGADDGASGVGVILEIARTIEQNPIDMGVDIVFFDAEDQGSNSGSDYTTWGQGAQYWSGNLEPPNYKPLYGILLDMVGAENATFGKEEYSMYFAGPVMTKIWTLAQRMGYSDYFQDFNAGGVTDDHLFVNRIAKIPMIDIINISPSDRTSFVPYHHTHEDSLDKISKRTLRVVGQVVTAVLYKESEGSLQ